MCLGVQAEVAPTLVRYGELWDVATIGIDSITEKQRW